MIRVLAPAKLNLFLHVGGKRDDGYHDLQSLVVFAGVADTLTFESADALSMEIEGPFAAELAVEPNNLVLKAANAFASAAGHALAARIRLTKALPVAAGIGGGSADAAATMRGLNALWQAGLTQALLEQTALALGSDVPACLASAPLWMEGRGERITPLSQFPALPLVLVNPRLKLSTADVFAALEARRGNSLGALPSAFHDRASLLKFLSGTVNDLEAPARQRAPEIRDVLAGLSHEGAVFARMSGSGATCFGIYETEQQAARAAEAIAANRPGWWVKAAHVAPANIGEPLVV